MLPFNLLWLSMISPFVVGPSLLAPYPYLGPPPPPLPPEPGWEATLINAGNLFYISAAILAIAYGAAVVAAARGSRLSPVWMFPGLGANPTAKRWYGLAFVIPGPIAWGALAVVHPAPPAPYLLLSWFLAPASVVGCLLLARASTNRSVKRAILTGSAPSYLISPDARWWWNGDTWAGVGVTAPEGALRSPDDNYWWTGRSWLAMPPRAFTSDQPGLLRSRSRPPGTR